jgi:alkylation response protein AidB-like acyl-CoA dehydrogenase
MDRHDEPDRAAGRLRPRRAQDPRRARRRPLPITGQKIFITYGDHDMTDNIVHLVLARLPDAPAGHARHLAVHRAEIPGRETASLGEAQRSALRRLEHKLGIHASPTCVMAYGDTAARSAIWSARRTAAWRHVHHDEQRPAGNVGCRASPSPSAPTSRRWPMRASACRAARPAGTERRAPIIHHPDVRRMLMTMKAKTEAMRGRSPISPPPRSTSPRMADRGDAQAAPGLRSTC